MKKKVYHSIFIIFGLILFSSLIIYLRSFSTNIHLSPNKGLYYNQENVIVGDRVIALSKNEDLNVLVYGPYIDLPPGNYNFNYQLFNNGTKGSEKIVLDVVSDDSTTIHLAKEFSGDQLLPGLNKLSYSINMHEGASQIQTRLFTNSTNIILQTIDINQNHNKFPYLWKLFDIKLLIISMIFTFLFIRLIVFISKKFSTKSIFTTLFLVLVIGSYFIPKHTITGDEPHYLFNTKNLLINKTLDMEQAYSPSIMDEFWSGTIDKDAHVHQSVKTGNFYSHHAYFTSLLLIPGYLLAGEIGVKIEMSLLSFAVALLSVLILQELGFNDKKINFYLAFGMFLFTPLIYYSYAIYPEIIAALIFLFGLLVGLKKNFILKFLGLIALGLSIHLKTKYILPSLFISTYILLTYLLQNKKETHTRSKWVKLLLLIVSSFLSVGSYFVINYILFGNFSLFSYYSGGKTITNLSAGFFKLIVKFLNTFLANFFGSRSGILVWLPITMFFPAGVYRLFKSATKQKLFALFSLLAVVSYIVFYSFSGSIGGASPPIRPWVAVLPIVLLISTISLNYLKNKILLFAMLSISFYQILGSYVYDTTVINIYSHKFNPFFEKTGTFFSHIGLLFPQMTGGRPIEAWDVFCIIYWLLIVLITYKSVFNIKFQLKKHQKVN